MKKILGISLVALFAAAPMMAEAAKLESKSITPAGENVVADTNRVAAVSYVKGAYNAVVDSVNSAYDEIATKQAQLKVGNADIDTAVVASSAISSTAATANDGKLVTEKAVLTAIEAASSDLSGNISSLAGRLDTAEGSIETLTSADSTVQGSVAHAEASAAAAAAAASAAQQSADSALASFANYTTTTGMNTLLDSKIDKTSIDTTLDGDSTDADVASAKAAYTYANSAASAAETAAKSYAKDYADDLNTTMDGRVNALETANSALASGVSSAIMNATYALDNDAVSGNVIAMASWDSDATTTIALQSGKVNSTAVSATSATYTE